MSDRRPSVAELDYWHSVTRMRDELVGIRTTLVQIAESLAIISEKMKGSE